jgi:hypothetical protein
MGPKFLQGTPPRYAQSRTAGARWCGTVDAIQPPFNLIHREAAGDVLPWAREHEAGAVVYSPMASGLLSGAFTAARAARLEPGDWRAGHPDFTQPAVLANLALAQALRPVAERHPRHRGWQRTRVAFPRVRLRTLPESACGKETPRSVRDKKIFHRNGPWLLDPVSLLPRRPS